MTQRELMEEGIDVQRGQERVAEILSTALTTPVPTPMETMMRPADAFPVTLKYRKRRSDAGVKKGPKVQAKAGVLTVAQIGKLRDLMEAREQALEANTKAEQAILDACREFDAYLDSLTAK